MISKRRNAINLLFIVSVFALLAYTFISERFQTSRIGTWVSDVIFEGNRRVLRAPYKKKPQKSKTTSQPKEEHHGERKEEHHGERKEEHHEEQKEENHEEQKVEQKNEESHVEPVIPHNLIFTSDHNILETKEPALFYNNIQHTIKTYSDAWKGENVRVIFLDDAACDKLVEEVEGRLINSFRKEARGAFKADICRIAALYIHGGYYFDIDIQVVKPLLLSPEITFSTPIVQRNPNLFFQAFMACAKGHPLLRRALVKMLDVYEGRLPTTPFLGPMTLKVAYDSLELQEKAKTLFLAEISLKSAFAELWYKDFPRQQGYGCCCNYAVHHPSELEILFYSRIVDAGFNCRSTPVLGLKT